jgi:hypothetical protein
VHAPPRVSPASHPLPHPALQVAGTSGKVQVDGGSDDEGAAQENYGAAIMEALGAERRNEVRGRSAQQRTAAHSSAAQRSTQRHAVPRGGGGAAAAAVWPQQHYTALPQLALPCPALPRPALPCPAPTCRAHLPPCPPCTPASTPAHA